MTYDPRDHALHGKEIIAGLALWFLVVLASGLIPRSFEAALNGMVQQDSASWTLMDASLTVPVDDRAS